MTILAIDTSTSRGSVALLAGDALLLDENFTADRSHSASLFAVLARARALAPRLDQIAIGLGPGSYAGIRIAIAAAIGMELALGARLVGLASVAALENAPREYVVIGDARRGSFYWTRVEDGRCVTGPELIDEPTLHTHLATNTLPLLATEPLALAPTAVIALPTAAALAHLAAQDCGIVATDRLEPIYLRDPHITQPKQLGARREA